MSDEWSLCRRSPVRPVKRMLSFGAALGYDHDVCSVADQRAWQTYADRQVIQCAAHTSRYRAVFVAWSSRRVRASIHRLGRKCR
jgi:hypothetical protein